MNLKKCLLAVLITPVLSLPLSSCGESDVLASPTGTLDRNILTWNETMGAVKYDIVIKQNDEVIKEIEKNISEPRHIDLDDYEIPFGNTRVELIASSAKDSRSIHFDYVESTIRNLKVVEDSYNRNNPAPGYNISYYHHGIEFELGTQISISQIEGKELVGSQEDMLRTYGEIKDLYSSFLHESDAARKQEYADMIGNDIIVSYFYYDNESVEPIHFYTKQKYWAQYLNYKAEDGTFSYFGSSNGYFNSSITENTYRTAVNFNPDTTNIAPISNNTLFTEVTVIKDGLYASRTTSVKIDPIAIKLVVKFQ